MRVCFALLIALVATDSSAAPRSCRGAIPRISICSPSADEVASIVRAINEAIAAKAFLEERIATERDSRMNAADGDYEALEAWNSVNFERSKARSQATRKFEAAIAKIAETYGINPKVPGRTLTDEPYAGVRLDWTPRPWLGEGTVYSVDDNVGAPHFLPGLKSGEESGIRANGDMLLDIRIFDRAATSRDPLDLALILVFETARYDGVASGKSPVVIQKSAIEAEIAAARALGAPQARIDRLNLEWKGLVNGHTPARPLPESTDYFEHVRLSNVWQGELEGERQRLLRNLISQSEQRAAQEREARRQRELDELGQSLFGGLDTISERMCSAAQNGRVPDSMHEDWIRWRNGNYLAFTRELPIVDLADLSIVVGCPEFLKNQILMARRRGYGHGVVTFEWMAEIVMESYRRLHPTIPTWPSSPPSTVTPPDSPPDEFPDVDVPGAPSVPHCRYHPWCQEKTPPPQDN